MAGSEGGGADDDVIVDCDAVVGCELDVIFEHGLLRAHTRRCATRWTAGLIGLTVGA